MEFAGFADLPEQRHRNALGLKDAANKVSMFFVGEAYPEVIRHHDEVDEVARSGRRRRASNLCAVGSGLLADRAEFFRDDQGGGVHANGEPIELMPFARLAVLESAEVHEERPALPRIERNGLPAGSRQVILAEG